MAGKKTITLEEMMGGKAPQAAPGEDEAAGGGGAAAGGKKKLTKVEKQRRVEQQRQRDALELERAQQEEKAAAARSKLLSQTCRFYERAMPQPEEVVMVEVLNIAEQGAEVKLLEYNNIPGLVLLSELSRRRIRSINKLIKVGRQEPVMVLRVDDKKGYIDLSKRRVSKDDLRACEERYNKASNVQTIVRHIANSCASDLEDLSRRLTWPLYQWDEDGAMTTHAYDVFMRVAAAPEVLDTLELELTEQERKMLLQQLKLRLKPSKARLRAEFAVTCFCYEGIDAVQRALRAGQQLATESFPLKVQLIGSPDYVMMATALEPQKGLELMRDSLARIRREIEAAGGEVHVKAEPYVASQVDDDEDDAGDA